MPKFWVSIHHPQGFDASVSEGPEIRADIDALNDEMVAAGIRVFVGGLHGPSEARSIRLNADGSTTTSNELYLGTQEYVGGFWVLEVADMDAALEWGAKAAKACRRPVEVRQFH